MSMEECDEDLAAYNNKETIPTEFECAICIKLLFDPVSTPCGHTFCQHCINQSLHYRSACPLCRTPVPMGAKPNTLLSSIIAKKFPKETENRKRDLVSAIVTHDEECRNHRRRAAGSGRDMPILPFELHYGPIVPGETLDIQVTVVTLIQHSLEGNRRFGVVFNGQRLSQGFYGLCVEIISHQPIVLQTHPERQHMIVKIIGLFRIAIVDHPRRIADGYDIATVEPIFDLTLSMAHIDNCCISSDSKEFQNENLGNRRSEYDSFSVDTAPLSPFDEAKDICRSAQVALEAQLIRAGTSGRSLFTRKFGNIPSLPPQISCVDIEKLSFWYTRVVCASAHQRWQWFSCTDTLQRLKEIHHLLNTGSENVLALGLGSSGPDLLRFLLLQGSRSSAILFGGFILLLLYCFCNRSRIALLK